MAHRPFGTIRKLPSGRWQARYREPITNVRITAPDTFSARAEANRWLANVQADLVRGSWVDPRAGEITLAEFGDRWIDEHPSLRPRTLENYRDPQTAHPPRAR